MFTMNFGVPTGRNTGWNAGKQVFERQAEGRNNEWSGLLRTVDAFEKDNGRLRELIHEVKCESERTFLVAYDNHLLQPEGRKGWVLGPGTNY